MMKHRKLLCIIYFFFIGLKAQNYLEFQQTKENNSLSTVFLKNIQKVFQQAIYGKDLTFIERSIFVIFGDNVDYGTIQHTLDVFSEVHWFSSSSKQNIPNLDRLHIYYDSNENLINKVFSVFKTSPIIFITDHEQGKFSLFKKLDSIKLSCIYDVVILIDNADMFSHPELKVNQQVNIPSMQELIKKILSVNYNFVLLKKLIPMLRARECYGWFHENLTTWKPVSIDLDAMMLAYNAYIEPLYQLIQRCPINKTFDLDGLKTKFYRSKAIIDKFKNLYQQNIFTLQLNVFNFPLEGIDDRLQIIDYLNIISHSPRPIFWHNIAICADILIAYPAHDSKLVSQAIEGITFSRLYNNDYSIKELMDNMLKIMQSSLKEEHAISTYADQCASKNQYYYRFYKALILIKTGQYNAAQSILLELYNAGFKNWIINWYLAQISRRLHNEESFIRYCSAIPKNILNFLNNYHSL